ncbi:MAG: DNA primase [Clostridia bacterium]|nr:DNA primase [Clostridia bacterium]
MAGRIGQEWFDELFSRVRIDEVIGQYVTLIPKGKYLWACCPFHSEKTPSFKVDTEEGLYYCFGCHKAGNAITFLKDYEHLETREAMKILAEQAHMQLPDSRDADPIKEQQDEIERQHIYEANVFAARFFHNTIWTPEGAQGLKYLYSRGFNDGDIKRFGLGFAPEHGGLHDALTEAGFDDATIQKAWLCGEKDGRKYDMFRNRVIFPIINQRDKVVGFGGRVMGKGEPKYLNTSDTPVFLKRNGVYGLNFMKGVRPKRLVLVEGYMDTVMLLKYGISGVVATLGTALTEEQIRLMKRYAHEIWISYDGDPPGQKAALRALDMLEPAGVDVKVIDYPSGMDPDEYLKAYGAESWEALPKHKPAKYRLLRAEDGLELSTQEGLTEYTVRSCAILKQVKNAVERENYLRELVNRTGYPREVLLRQIGVSRPETPRAPSPPRQTSQPERTVSANERAQMQLIALLSKKLIPMGLVSREDFDNEVYAEACDNIKEGIKPQSYIDQMPDEQLKQLMEALNFTPLPETGEEALKLADELLETIAKSRINSRISVLEKRLLSAQENEKPEIWREISELSLKL